MYIVLGILLAAAILCLLLFHWRKKRIIQKICHMSVCNKQELLNELAEPLGYLYDEPQDIFTNYSDAWQKVYGYGKIYDRLAPRFSMILDCLPLYFDYQDKTWLIEFWKGQYGINTGCEAGVYHADSILPPAARPLTVFEAAAEKECPEINIRLYRDGDCLVGLEKAQWWLTMFRMGCFSHPRKLCLGISISFPDYEMRDAFLDALAESGYDMSLVRICCTRICFSFAQPAPHHTCLLMRLYRCYVQWKNHLFCLLYRFVTRPFTDTCDKLLYLYFYFPFAFRRMLRLKRFRKRRHHGL